MTDRTFEGMIMKNRAMMDLVMDLWIQ